jgi:hypothetical protein
MTSKPVRINFPVQIQLVDLGRIVELCELVECSLHFLDSRSQCVYVYMCAHACVFRSHTHYMKQINLIWLDCRMLLPTSWLQQYGRCLLTTIRVWQQRDVSLWCSATVDYLCNFIEKPLIVWRKRHVMGLIAKWRGYFLDLYNTNTKM